MSDSKRRWVLGFALSSLAVFVSAQTPQDSAWNRVLAQERTAFQTLEQEQQASGSRQQALSRERVKAFREGVARLNAYRTEFIKDANSVSAVNALFRMGFYMEFAAWDANAFLYYDSCRRHSKIGDRDAVFGDPPRPLERQVQDRIAAVELRMKQRGSQGASVHSLFVLARYSGKGGIDVPGSAPPPDPLSSDEALAVARRLSFPEDSSNARQMWRQLLEQEPRLLPVSEDASVPGLLVFGLKGAPETTRQVAATLESYRRELNDRYFDAGLLAPTMVVFANLAQPAPATSVGGGLPMEVANAAAIPPSARPQQSPARQGPPPRNPAQAPPAQPEQTAIRTTISPEEIGRILSAKLHFRPMSDLEGYFEPLDHTLVLRKNLVGTNGQVFLGTALHELVHGLIQVDYPQAPPWLNEGLAALHEEYGPSGPRDNYRLYIATAAMAARGRWPSLEELLNARAAWWNSEALTVMAAASRYFCMFLLKEGQLPAVYKALRDAPATETTAQVLERVTGKSMSQLEAGWRNDLRGRNVSSLDSRWQQLRDPIQRYIANLPELQTIQ